MRRGWMLFLGMLIVAYLAADAMVSTLTLEDIARRPVVGLEREIGDPDLGPRRERLRVAQEADFFGAQAEGTVRPAGGVGMFLGYRYRYRLPDGGVVACGHVVRWMWCERGWAPVRASG